MIATMNKPIRYEPDYAVPPGDSLAELLDDRGMSQAELARRTGLSAKHINLILKGSASVTPDTALKLERVLDVPARIWSALEMNYQGHLSRLDEAKSLEEHVGWASKPLIKELITRGCIERAADSVGQLRELLKFFGVATVDAWNTVWSESAPLAAYRLARQDADPAALAAWMRIGEIRAAEVETETFDRESFDAALREARSLTRVADPHVWFPQLQEICRRAGVVVIIEKELPGARVNGVARWLTPTKALIQLSARYLRDDIVWFTFFHGGAHLLLHGKRSGPRYIPPTFVDTKDSSGRSEEEADSFAADLLIPASQASRLHSMRSLNDVTVFAAELGISPGIVIGRLHHEGLKAPGWGAGLIARYKW